MLKKYFRFLLFLLENITMGWANITNFKIEDGSLIVCKDQRIKLKIKRIQVTVCGLQLGELNNPIFTFVCKIIIFI